MTAESPVALRICIAVPYFSGLDLLRTALQSLIAQTDPNWSAIVVDDASPEPGAAEAVAALGDQRLRYVRNQHNLGVAENFNRCLGLGAAEADIVTVFHADDVLGTGYVAAIRAAHRRFPKATCVAPPPPGVGADGGARGPRGGRGEQGVGARRGPGAPG